MQLTTRPVLQNARSTFKPSDIHVVIPYSNHLRHQSRYHLVLEAVEHLLNAGVTLYVVELAHGDRQHILQLPSEVTHIKVRATDIMWHKENQINIGMRTAIANGARYLAWVDGDVQFTDPFWPTHTIEALQTHAIVQPWKDAVDLDHRRNLIVDERGRFSTESFCSVWLSQLASGQGYSLPFEKTDDPSVDYDAKAFDRKFGHPGYAWACTTDAYLAFDGLVDWAIIGSADTIMAFGFAGLLTEILERGGYWWTQDTYRPKIEMFQALCDRVIKRNIGFVTGTLLHGWHGPKAKRGYVTRPRILQASKFDPDLDLFMTPSGLYKFARDNYVLRDCLRHYMQSRDEDQLAN